MSTKPHFSVLLFATFVLGACGAAPEGEGDLERAEQPITGGDLLGAGEPFSVKINFISSDGRTWTSSANKIGPKRFLTCSHCIWKSWIAIGSKVQITNEGNGQFLQPDYTVARVMRYPQGVGNVATGHYTDVGMFDVAEESPEIDIFDTLRPTYVDVGLGGGWFNAWGCDLNDRSRDGQKQFGTFLTDVNPDPPSNAGYILARGQNRFQQICPGDSGGTLFFVRDGVWEIAGIGSAPGGDASYFTRINRVLRWIQNPTHNDFVHGSMGSLLNFKGNSCIRAASSSRAILTYCDLRAIPADRQYWALERVGTGNVFRIKNTQTGTCLTSTVTGNVQHQTCSSTSTRHRWTFTSPVLSPIEPNQPGGIQFFHIRNQFDSRCLHVPDHNVFNNVDVTTGNCSSGTLDSQVYAFIP